MAKSLELLARLSLVVQAVAKLAAVTIPSGFADTTIDRMLLPIEVLGSESRTVSRTIDPRIMISPFWAPIFQPLPIELHRAIKTSLLAAWMDKNQQYAIAKYLPVVGAAARAYTPTRSSGNISGGKVWEAARQFCDSGVPDQFVARLRDWGTRYVDRAARIQYDGLSRH